MLAPRVPETEAKRLAKLAALGILDSAPEERFDRITRIAQTHFGTPITLISLVAESRQWFKSSCGFDASEAPRETSFCGHAILGDEIFYIPDAREDVRFHDNPFVIGEPHIRFYAGAPVSTSDGVTIGTLCVIDMVPRTLTEADFGMLRDLADCVEYEIERNEIVLRAVELDADRARLDAVMNAVVDGIVTVNPDGVVESANEAAGRILGYPATGLVGLPVETLMTGLALSRALQPEGAFEGAAALVPGAREVVGIRRNGTTFPMDLAVSETQIGGQRLYTGILRDITERKQAERLKREFVATVSHELRTPLTSIKGALSLIKSGLGGEVPEMLKRLFDIADSNSDRLIRLINDILDVEKIEAGEMEFQMETLELCALLAEAIEANKSYGEAHGVRFELAAIRGRALAVGDHHRLMQVLDNLLSNAAKFSPRDGVVKVTLEADGAGFRISVSDHGPGIPADFQSKLFTKFSQADSSDARSKGGTGLGLSIAQSLVMEHGSRLEFETEAGVGTTFHFTLSAVEAAAGSALPAPADGAGPARAADGGGWSVLHVEHDPDVIDVVRCVLGELGEVTPAATLGSARQLLRETAFDLVVLERALPDGDADELLPLLRQPPHAATKVMLFSALEKKGDSTGRFDAVLLKSRTTNRDLLEKARACLYEDRRARWG